MTITTGRLRAEQVGLLWVVLVVFSSASCQKPVPASRRPSGSEQLGTHSSIAARLKAAPLGPAIGKNRSANSTAVDTGTGIPEHWEDEDLTSYLLEAAANYAAAPKMGEERALILEDMVAIGTPGVLKLLRGLFEKESEVESKLDILAAAQDVPKGIDIKLALLESAVSDEQPFEVRFAGIDGLAGLRDPKVMPLLRRLQNDPDPKIQRLGRNAEQTVFSGG